VHVLRLWAAVGKISVADGQDTIGREETWATSDPVYPQMSHRIDYIQIRPQRQTRETKFFFGIFKFDKKKKTKKITAN